MTEQPAGPLRFRSATLSGVSYPDRTIELIVTPYETETLVDHPNDRNRMIFEIFSRGAFDGIQRRPNRIKVNRDHDRNRPVGKAVALHPSREEGLVAEIKIARTQLGDETLSLADEGILDASAGYLPMPGGERWEGRNRCRITKAWLGHIAMTAEPAYEDAKVLSVRAAPEAGQPLEVERVETPNLDVVRGWLLADRYAKLELGR